MALLLSIQLVNSQLYTPSGIIAGSSSNANVGVGTSTPATKFYVAGGEIGTDNGLRFFGTTPYVYSNGNQYPLRIEGSTVILQSHGGNVGIGVDPAVTPVAKLDIYGGTNFIGNALSLRAGNPISSNPSNQILFSYYGTTNYTHAIKSQHYSLGAAGNTLQFYLWNYGVDAINTVGTKLVMTLNGLGNVGIGIADPGDARLRVAGHFVVNGIYNGDMVDIVNSQPDLPANSDLIWGGWNVSQVNNPRLFSLTSNGRFSFAVHNNGQVGINCDPGNSAYMLSVNGKITAEGMTIVQDVPAADYVFDNNYKLLSLKDLSAYVKSNQHLPEIPSACDFQEKGYSVGEMDNLLLKKIEELTLYTIQQQQQIENLSKEIELLKTKN